MKELYVFGYILQKIAIKVCCTEIQILVQVYIIENGLYSSIQLGTIYIVGAVRKIVRIILLMELGS